MKGKTVLLNVVILVLLLVLATASAANGESKMYWTDAGTTNKIQRANLDGTEIEDLVTGLEAPRGIALDVAAGKMYWVNAGTAQKIQRANLDGTSVEDVVTGLDDPTGIALDTLGGKMYWTDADKFAGKIQRANLDGTSVEDVVTGLDDPQGIALDIVGGKMYWTEAGTTNKIQRANLDGTGVEELVIRLEALRGIALDIVGGKMYWANAGTAQKIQRANLDGTGVEDLVTGLDMPWAIVLAQEQETEAFTYQGRLIDANSAADGLYDFQFELYDGPADANQQAGTIYINDMDVIDGYFTVELGFDARVFTGDARWLQIGVRPGDSNDVYTSLSPRQEVTPVPYALHTLHTRGLFVGDENTFVGVDAGYSNTEGDYNTFLGREAGYSNTTGTGNIFSGFRAGYSNTTGNENTFVGNWAGYNNKTGDGNVFIGYQAGHNEPRSNKLYISNSNFNTIIYGDFSTGNVCIGTTNPAEKLNVGGNVKADSLVYSSPRTHYFVVGGEAFNPATDVAYQNSGGTGGAFIESGSSSNALVAPVHLPQGAVVSEFKVFFNDNSTSDILVYLLRLNLTGGSNYMMAYVNSSGISGYGNKTDTMISEATIDNTVYAYSVKALSMSWDGSNMRIMGAVITYMISEAP